MAGDGIVVPDFSKGAVWRAAGAHEVFGMDLKPANIRFAFQYVGIVARFQVNTGPVWNTGIGAEGLSGHERCVKKVLINRFPPGIFEPGGD
jgi:hypothetical protein